jgi:hypothetical protein
MFRGAAETIVVSTIKMKKYTQMDISTKEPVS